MARGWESKSVEAQIEASDTSQGESTKNRWAPEAAAAIRKRETLNLARIHIQQQLQTTQHPRRSAMLESALADLDKQIASLDKPSMSAGSH